MVFMRTKCNRMELIKHLNLWGNDLRNISVIRQMTNLEVLSLSVNRVGSLSALRGCPKLRELYLRKNDIRDLAEVQCLANLQNLRVLWLNENPCATLPHYRMYVLQRLPNLEKLDSQEVTADERRQAQYADLADVPTRVDDDSEESPREEGYPAAEALDESHGWGGESCRAQPRASFELPVLSTRSCRRAKRSSRPEQHAHPFEDADGIVGLQNGCAKRSSRACRIWSRARAIRSWTVVGTVSWSSARVWRSQRT